ncbi:MAG: hypothetical protein Q9170_006893 [Blastenia crenularia]
MFTYFSLFILALIPLTLLATPVDDIETQWSHQPGNHQNDDNVCPDYKTCSIAGHNYYQSLLSTISNPHPTDRTNGKIPYDTLYESEIIPLGDYGAGIRPDLQARGIDYRKMTLWASSSKDPDTGEVSIDAAYGNIIDTAKGVIIAVENFREFDQHRASPDSDADSGDETSPSQHTGLPWSEIIYQTWQRAHILETTYYNQKLPIWTLPGADLSTLQYSIQNKIDNPQTQRIINLAYSSMGYPLKDATWKRWTFEETPNWYFALLGTDNCKGTVWLLNDHAGEAGGKFVREVWTRWGQHYPDICYDETSFDGAASGMDFKQNVVDNMIEQDTQFSKFFLIVLEWKPD